MNWCEIPAGSFLMGSKKYGDKWAYRDEKPQHELYLPTFYITRYPITNAQYQLFVESGGYDVPRYWTETGWAWREKENITEPHRYSMFRNLLNHPVVRINWYEALAYCKWLGEVIGQSVTLPSEAEWEKAARGTDGRRWPWGNEPDPNRANYNDTGIDTISEVGCFPGGASPYGVEDMSGNAWEWTRSLYRDYPYDTDDGRENLETDGYSVVRGGGFSTNTRQVRCAYRLSGDKYCRIAYLGFRAVVRGGAFSSDSWGTGRGN